MDTLRYLAGHYPQVLQLTGQHLEIALLGVLYAALVGIPTALLINRFRWLAEPVLWLANAVQTVPALALVGFVMIFTGLTRTTGVIVLFLYGLMPIIRAAYTGLSEVDRGVVEAARGMGMTRWQIMRMVELPLALPVLLVGVRLATVVAIGTASIMSLAGSGGLGQLIFAGIDRVQDPMILAGALPAALLAVIAEVSLSALERRLRADGVRRRRTAPGRVAQGIQVGG